MVQNIFTEFGNLMDVILTKFKMATWRKFALSGCFLVDIMVIIKQRTDRSVIVCDVTEDGRWLLLAAQSSDLYTWNVSSPRDRNTTRMPQ